MGEDVGLKLLIGVWPPAMAVGSSAEAVDFTFFFYVWQQFLFTLSELKNSRVNFLYDSHLYFIAPKSHPKSPKFVRGDLWGISSNVNLKDS